MGIFVSKRRKQPRRFSYEPRYYDPKRDDNIKRKMRIRSRARRRNPAGNIVFLATLLFFALYIYYKMNGVDLFDYIF